MSGSVAVELATTPGQVAAVADRAARAPHIALDTEANGLFAFEARLCVVQLAWREDDRDVVAIVDALATPVAPLGAVLRATSPTKVLHDLTFDVRLLAGAGIEITAVSDTEVTARLLGRPALGLASLLSAELGISISKSLQRHDWSRRPLAPAHVAYLAGDVAHLLRLDDHLRREAEARDLTPEIACETSYKLRAAGQPEGDGRPAWARAKGASDLDAPSRAILRRLLSAREAIARRLDVPPFHVIGSRELASVAARRPTSEAALASALGKWTSRWPGEVPHLLEAVRLGLADGDVPEEEKALAFPAPPPRSVSERRRRMEQAIGAWRRREAAARGWCEQAVLPGHCARSLAPALADASSDQERRDAIAAIPGLGERRRTWFLDAWLEVGRAVLDAPAPTP